MEQINKTHRKTQFSNLSEQIKSVKKVEIIDIKYSCEYIFQYLTDNNTINQKYMNLQFMLCFLNQVYSNTIIIFIFLLIRPPTSVYKYSCYDVTTKSYVDCIYRSFISCSSNCTFKCYYNPEYCSQLFNGKYANSDIEATKYDKIYIFFEKSLSQKLNIYDYFEELGKS